jgi:AraC family transcriptional regulator
MKKLAKGSFFGVTKKKVDYGGLLIADMITPAPQDVPWHYHENPYFTYFIRGHLTEVNKKESYICTPGKVIFHNSQESHYNTKHSEFTHFFHMELNGNWFERHGLRQSDFEGSIFLNDPFCRSLFNRIYREVYVNDSVSAIAVEALTIQTFVEIVRGKVSIKKPPPAWVEKVKEMVYDLSSDSISLGPIARELNITPTHLSQMFPKYFNVTFGEYIRRIRVDKATSMMPSKNLTLTDIAVTCGFSDQSHFIRCFKEVNGMSPSEYRKMILKP